MPTLHDLMASSIDGRAAALGAADASPTGATRALITRRRRRNAAVAGGSSALALGALVAAVVARDRADTAPANPDAIAYTTVTIANVSADGQLTAHERLTCGEPVPASSADADGFSQTEVKLWGDPVIDPLENKPAYSATVTYTGADRPPVLLDEGYAVLAKDGVVVGIYSNYNSTEVPLVTPTPGQTWKSVVTLSRVQACGDMGTSGTGTAIAAGDYEIYMVSHAYITPPDLALHGLAERGFSFARTDYGDWAPGSIDCESFSAGRESSTDPIPLECNPDAVPNATIDTTTGVATLPYAAADYTDDVDVTLVSEPTPLRIAADITWLETGSGWVSSEPPTVTITPAELTCGAPVEYLEATTSFYGTVDSSNLDALLGGDEVAAEFDTPGGVAVGTAEVPSTATAWLLGSSDPQTGPEQVVGWATIEVLPTGTFAINRWAGYPDGSIRLSDITWCGEPRTTVWSIVAVGDVTVTGDAETETGGGLAIYVQSPTG